MSDSVYHFAFFELPDVRVEIRVTHRTVSYAEDPLDWIVADDWDAVYGLLSKLGRVEQVESA